MCLGGTEVTVAWRGRVVLRGRLATQPQARTVQVSAGGDGDTVRIDVRVEPAPDAPVASAWLSLAAC